MVDEALDPILIQVTVPLPIPMIFSAWTVNEQLQGWLSDRAQVTPEVGGQYLLGWKSPVEFESPGKVLQLTSGVDVGFSWFGPPPFARLMNEPSPKTQVYVRLQESPEGVDVTLEHSGWESGEAWEEARSWHFHFWDERLQQFKDYLIKAAYG
jgi:uncharacterized protein YndB with AHSA1/START domain